MTLIGAVSTAELHAIHVHHGCRSIALLLVVSLLLELAVSFLLEAASLCYCGCGALMQLSISVHLQEALIPPF